MTTSIKGPQFMIVIGVFVWVGMVLGISFLESWLKFQAPGITIALGVGIGRLVFSALNKVELLLATIVAIGWWQSKGLTIKGRGLAAFGIAVAVLLIQTTILLPVMDNRAEMHLAGLTVPPSNLHFYYVGGEILKLSGLVIFGVTNMKFITKTHIS